MSALDADTLRDRLAAAADPVRLETGTPGLVIGVLSGAERRYHCAGVTSLRDPHPVTPDTLFRYCSLTKPVTAIATLALRDEGHLNLDQPIGELPVASTWPQTARERTVRQLLDHTAGWEGEWPGNLATFGAGPDAAERLIAEYGRLRTFAPPGRAFGYCNPGYWMLGQLIAKLAHRPIEDALKAYVLDPLSLDHVVSSVEDAKARPLAAPHEPDPGATQRQRLIDGLVFPRARFASGGLLGSGRALLELAADQLAPTSAVLSNDTRAEMVSATVPGGRPDRRQGLGWAVDDYGDRWSYGHSGSYTGYAAHLQIVPHAGVAVAVLANSTSGWAVRTAVADALAEELGAGGYRPPPLRPSDPALDAARAGRYGYPGCRSLILNAVDSGLAVALDGVDGTESVERALARPVSDTDYVLVDGSSPGMQLSFLPELPGVLRLGLRLGQREGGV